MNFSGDDIRLDEKAVSDAITQSCRRCNLYVEGIAAVGDMLTVICSDAPDSNPRIYRLSQLENPGTQELFAELRNRYNSSFRTAGAFALPGGVWVLVEKTIEE